MPLHCRTHLGRQACRELLVILVDEPVLIAQREGIRHPHADVLVGPDQLASTGLDRSEPARKPAVQVLHGGDSGRDHLERGVERVEIEIEIAGHQARGEPQFERHVGRTELDRRQADVVVAIDEAG